MAPGSRVLDTSSCANCLLLCFVGICELSRLRAVSDSAVWNAVSTRQAVAELRADVLGSCDAAAWAVHFLGQPFPCECAVSRASNFGCSLNRCNRVLSGMTLCSTGALDNVQCHDGGCPLEFRNATTTPTSSHAPQSVTHQLCAGSGSISQGLPAAMRRACAFANRIRKSRVAVRERVQDTVLPQLIGHDSAFKDRCVPCECS